MPLPLPNGSVGCRLQDKNSTVAPGRLVPCILLALLGLGLAVRFRQYFAGVSYWYDEAYLLLNIHDRSYLNLLGAIDYQQPSPPFFLWLLRGLFLLLGPSELAMRLPAFLTGLAALLVMIPLARCLVGTPGWLWAFGFCALSAHAVMHACEVRPYEGDVLFAECILLATATRVIGESPPRGRRLSLVGLYLLALLAPWFSFASPFVLGAASLALFADACQRPAWNRWVNWIGFSTVLLLSGFALWYFDARHLYYPGLTDYWQVGFLNPDDSLIQQAHWTLGRLILIGHYGTTGMGIPLLVLAVVGGVFLARRSVPLVVLLAGPIVLGLGASCLRKYPMDDRLLFFAVPSVWLLASAGIGTILQKLRGAFPEWRGRALRIATLVSCTLLLPGTVTSARELIRVVPRVDFREAFAYVHQRWQPGDTLYVLHSEVYETYFGKQEYLLGNRSPKELVEHTAQRGRLWFIYTPPPSPDAMPEGLFPRLEQHGCVGHQHLADGCLRIVLFRPPPR